VHDQPQKAVRKRSTPRPATLGPRPSVSSIYPTPSAEILNNILHSIPSYVKPEIIQPLPPVPPAQQRAISKSSPALSEPFEAAAAAQQLAALLQSHTTEFTGGNSGDRATRTERLVPPLTFPKHSSHRMFL
jgi:hypothetical protein